MKPSENDPLNKLINTIFEKKFEELISKYIKGRLIDIGCGEKPYKDMLSPHVQEHVGVDLVDTSNNNSNIEFIGTAYDIPVADETFDSAVCTAVLEHLEEPALAIKECYRILKPGAVALYSMPFIWHLHAEPRDFFRYSKYGLQHLFETNGFKVLEITPLSGFAVTFIQLHLYLVQGKFNRGIIKALGIYKLYLWLCTRFGLFINKYDHSQQFTWMYTVAAQK